MDDVSDMKRKFNHSVSSEGGKCRRSLLGGVGHVWMNYEVWVELESEFTNWIVGDKSRVPKRYLDYYAAFRKCLGFSHVPVYQ